MLSLSSPSLPSPSTPSTPSSPTARSAAERSPLRGARKKSPPPPSPRSPTDVSLDGRLQSFHCPSVELSWVTQLGLQLRGLLHWAEYTPEAISAFTRLYHSTIAQALPPGIVIKDTDATYAPSGRDWLWPSFMTDDHTPVEVGLAWKGQQQQAGAGTASKRPHTQVRFSIEAIDPREVRKASTNVRASEALAERLASAGLINVQDYLLLQELFVPAGTARPRQSEIFFGFDVTSAGSLDVKVYFVLGSTWSLDRLAQTLDALEAKTGLKTRQSLRHLVEYTRGLPASRRGFPVLAAFDLGCSAQSLRQSRCKLYWRFPTLDSHDVAAHATMAAPALPHQQESRVRQQWLHLLGELKARACPDWESLASRACQQTTGGTLIYFDLAAGRADLSDATAARSPLASSKVYTPIRHLVPTRADPLLLNSALQDYLAEHVPSFARQEEVGLADVLSKLFSWQQAHDAALTRHLGPAKLTYVCTEFDKLNRPGFTLYFQPVSVGARVRKGAA